MPVVINGCPATVCQCVYYCGATPLVLPSTGCSQLLCLLCRHVTRQAYMALEQKYRTRVAASSPSDPCVLNSSQDDSIRLMSTLFAISQACDKMISVARVVADEPMLRHQASTIGWRKRWVATFVRCALPSTMSGNKSQRGKTAE